MTLSVGALQPAAKNVSAWQAYNRRRWAFEEEVLQPDERMPLVCECAAPTCVWAVELTLQEYESAHMCDHWTAVIPGHCPRMRASAWCSATRTSGWSSSPSRPAASSARTVW